MNSQIEISIVSPVYRAETIIDNLVERIVAAVSKLTDSYEIILVEDCGPDNSWAKIQENCNKNPKVKGIKLSRNYGQQHAMQAGLDASKGDYVITMDCDLQDRPEEIQKLYQKALEGYDIVLASRHKRKDSFFKKLFSKLFYNLLSYLTGYKHDESVANFGIYSKKVIEAVTEMRESVRYFPTMVNWVGFRSTKVNVNHAPREEGKSNYNFKSLFRLAMDIILSHSDKPIRILIKTGGIVSIGAFIIAIIYLYKWVSGDIFVLGYTSLIVSIWFLSGIIMATLGIVGLYVGKTFEGVRNRPLYIIKETIND